MRKTKRLFVIIGCVFFINCKNYHIIINPVNENQGFYFGSTFNLKVFVTIKNEKAIVDWFYEEVIPRFAFSDTLFIDKSDNSIWVSDLSKIKYINERLILETKGPYKPKPTVVLNLKKTTVEKWIKEFNVNKNVFYLRKEYDDFTKVNYTNIDSRIKNKLWFDLTKKYEFQLKFSKLTHDEFLLEFKKFKLELISKL